MKILIIGASGMLGFSLLDFFAKDINFKVYGIVRPQKLKILYPRKTEIHVLDEILNQVRLANIIGKIRPDIVINCVGLVKKFCIEENAGNVIAINSLFPHRLMEVANEVSARFIQISTDCVFSGAGAGMYKESDFADARDIYGLSKLLGETYQDSAITLRTSIIGHERISKNGLVEWFLSQKVSCQGYIDAIFSGFPTVVLAEIIRDYIIPNHRIIGLYHLASEPISKYDLLSIISSVYKKQINIVPNHEIRINRSLSGDRFNLITNFVPPNWSDMIQRMYLNELNTNVPK